MPLTPTREALLKKIVPPGSESKNPQAAEQAKRTLTDGDEAAVLALAASAIDDYQTAVNKSHQAALALSADKAELESQLEAAENAKDEALALSASAAPRTPDPVVAAMYTENIAAKREDAIAAGLPENAAKVFDRLVVDSGGTPTSLALSATADRKPLGFALWDAVKQATLILRGQKTPDPAKTDTMALDAGDGGKGWEESAREFGLKQAAKFNGTPVPA